MQDGGCMHCAVVRPISLLYETPCPFAYGFTGVRKRSDSRRACLRGSQLLELSDTVTIRFETILYRRGHYWTEFTIRTGLRVHRAHDHTLENFARGHARAWRWWRMRGGSLRVPSVTATASVCIRTRAFTREDPEMSGVVLRRLRRAARQEAREKSSARAGSVARLVEEAGGTERK